MDRPLKNLKDYVDYINIIGNGLKKNSKSGLKNAT